MKIKTFIGHVELIGHAQERWTERGRPDEKLQDSLGRAMPFGVQYGTARLLADGDLVFVVAKTIRGLVLKTILTMDMAIANMQVFHRNSSVIQPLIKESEKPTIPKAKKKKNQHQQPANLSIIFAMSLEDLVAEDAVAQGFTKHLIQHEIGVRNWKKKQQDHSDQQERTLAAYRQVLRHFLTEDQLPLAWKMVDEFVANWKK